MTAITAKDIMPDLLATVQGEATLQEAAGLMLQMDIGSLLVIDFRGDLIGIVTDSDFGPVPVDPSAGQSADPQVLGHRLGDEMQIEQVYRSARTRRVRDVMSAPVVTVEEDAPLGIVLARMYQNRIRHLPVMRGRRPVGMVSSRDLLQLVFAEPPPG